MPTHFDVAVLGGGVAGAAAALAASQLGARTCLIAGAPGATALFAGAWRGKCPEGLRPALADVGYDLRAATQRLPHPFGHLVGCNFAPTSHETTRLVEGTVVIGIAGLTGFDADMLALQWTGHAGVSLRAETLTIDHTPAAGWAPVSLAAQLGRTPDAIIEPLRAALRKHAAQHAVLPAVLGITHDHALHRVLIQRLDAVIGEALAVPPSLPGWRLHNALRAALEKAGITRFEGRALATERRNGRIHEIELLNGDVIAARSFVLATGKYAAGGLEVAAEFHEPAFGCPVWVEHLGERFNRADALILTDPDRTEDQPLLRAGVHTDAEHRPVNAENDVVYSNVFVAGSVRAGWSIMTHCIGDAASDGWSAGTKAVSV